VQVLNVFTNPQPRLAKDSGICTGDTRILNPGAFASYTWQNGSTQSAFNATGPGIYYVTVADNHLCRGSDTVTISKQWPLPERFLGPDTAICTYGTLKLLTPNNFDTYQWSTGAVSPALVVSAAGTYWLRVTDNHQCSATDTVQVVAKECLKGFFIPNAFSPNNDGQNDFFKPVIGGILKLYQFNIYNRWGQLVFSTNLVNEGWDGKYKGVLQDSNLFIWTCYYQLPEGAPQQAKGSFLLIR
jgi:gliding motility-associated-like protein